MKNFVRHKLRSECISLMKFYKEFLVLTATPTPNPSRAHHSTSRTAAHS